MGVDSESMTTRSKSIAAYIVSQDKSKILLVRQKFKNHHAVPADHPTGTYWDLPCGKIETNNFLADMAREVLEETGATITGRMEFAYETSRHQPLEDFIQTTTVMTASVNEDVVLQPQDPDQQILEARWFNMDEAKQILEEHPDMARREPLLEFMSSTDGIISRKWHYQADSNNVLHNVSSLKLAS